MPFVAVALAATPARISLKAQEEPLAHLLLRVAEAFGLSVVVGEDVRGRVTLALHDVDVDQAFSAILAPGGYVFHRSGSVVIVERAGDPHPAASATPLPQPMVVTLSVIRAQRAAALLHALFPQARVGLEGAANAVVVSAPAEQEQAMRAVLQSLDVPDPSAPTVEALPLRSADARTLAARVHELFPQARVSVGPNHTLIVSAAPVQMTQIKALLGGLDTPPSTPPPLVPSTEAVRVDRARPADVARAIAHEFPSVRAAVAGSTVVLSGPPEQVEKAKALIAQVDVPVAGERYAQVYRLHYVDAKSVAELIARSFPDARVQVDEELNAISVEATAAEQRRIADALAQLDAPPGGTPGVPTMPGVTPSIGGPGGTNVEVVALRSATPGLGGSPSTSAQDIAGAVSAALQQSAPDLRITVPANSTELVLAGSPYSIRLAKELIAKLDVAPPLVVLDTEVLELDESVAKNLGLLFPQPLLSTTYSETVPPANASGIAPPLLRLQPLTRTPLALSAQLNFLVQNGTARVLADPRITTLSGRTATIRAGDTIGILTTTGGGPGTIATTQLQTFQTGVTLDITPVVDEGNTISVSLHPVVNSLSGLVNGIPQIATRDTQTTVDLHDDQTLVIGGLIQESTTRTENKLPLLGDIPLVGRVFRNQTLNHNRNELIIVVTPHLLRAGQPYVQPGPALPAMPTPQPLPTLPPGTTLPPQRSATPEPGSTPAPAIVPTPVAPPSSAATPLPTPGAFASTNVFRYGKAPSNTYAGPGDPVQIFYAEFSPTVLARGTLVTVSAITTTNVSRIEIGASGFTTQLQQLAPGQWAAHVPFGGLGLPYGQQSVQLTLTATGSLGGAAASIQIPVSILPQ